MGLSVSGFQAAARNVLKEQPWLIAPLTVGAVDRNGASPSPLQAGDADAARRESMRPYLVATAACLLALASPLAALAQPAPAPTPAPPSTPPAEAKDVQPSDSEVAKALLMRTADYLANASDMSVTMQTGYDVVQQSGQKVEFDETRHVLLHRPGDLRIDIERGNGGKEQVLFDGKTLTMFNPVANAYAQLQKTGSVDDIIHYIVGDLKKRMPLSALLVTTLPEELEDRITEIAPVDAVDVGGTLTDHLAARTKDIDFQVWIARGEQPVPLRAVLTYKNEPGQPQFWARLTDWNFEPKIEASTFTFTPPAGAEAVPFMIPVLTKAGQSRVGR
jgi:hypothetical protein